MTPDDLRWFRRTDSSQGKSHLVEQRGEVWLTFCRHAIATDITQLRVDFESVTRCQLCLRQFDERMSVLRQKQQQYAQHRGEGKGA